MVPVLEGVVERRLVVHFRVDVDAARGLLPAGLAPIERAGRAVAGVTLVRLGRVRPRGLKPLGGLGVETMVHWLAARGEDGRKGLFRLRHDTESRLLAAFGGPAAAHRARFEVVEDEKRLKVAVRTGGGAADFLAEVDWAAPFQATASFASLAEAQRFFADLDGGFAAGRGQGWLGVLRLEPPSRQLAAVRLERARARLLEEGASLAAGAVTVDGALGARAEPFEWVRVEKRDELGHGVMLPGPA
jgi:hypothetical protein